MIVEFKVDGRARHTSGPKNRLDNKVKGPLPRHIREIQAKLARIILSPANSNGSIELPHAFYMVYLRGTLPHVAHRVQLNYRFLAEWRLGIQIAMAKGYFTPEQKKSADLVIDTIKRRIELLDADAASRRQKLATHLPGTLNQKTFGVNGLAVEPENPDKPKTKTVVPPWPLKSIKKLISQESFLSDYITRINFGGDSFYKLASFLRGLSLRIDYEGQQEQIYKDSQDLYAWLTDLYKTDQIGGPKTQDTFLATTGELSPYFNEQGGYVGDYCEVNARRFLLEFGGQLLLHIRNLYPEKEQRDLYKDEFRLLRFMAEKLKDNSFIFFLGSPDNLGSRNILRGGLKKKERRENEVV
jgi:hypothetical protein